jgi:hypothetical protein
MYKLFKLTIFIVLYYCYNKNKDIIIKFLDLFIIGKFGIIVEMDEDLYSKSLYIFKEHIGAFVKSCLDADRDSDVSRCTSGWMVESMFLAGLARRRKSSS